MKTGKEWFELLTKEQQEKFKENCGEDALGWKMKRVYSSFNDFMECSFFFDLTEQGADYWHEIAIQTF